MSNATPKQIAYAESLKADFIAAIRRFEVSDAGEEFLAKLIVTPENAVAWIDQKIDLYSTEMAIGLSEYGEQDEIWTSRLKRISGRKLAMLVA